MTSMNIKTDRLPPYVISNYVTSPRKMSFQDWLKAPVMTEGVESSCTHSNFIVNFTDDLKKVVDACGYIIDDKNLFENDIATFIYRLSREKL